MSIMNLTRLTFSSPSLLRMEATFLQFSSAFSATNETNFDTIVCSTTLLNEKSSFFLRNFRMERREKSSGSKSFCQPSNCSGVRKDKRRKKAKVTVSLPFCLNQEAYGGFVRLSGYFILVRIENINIKKISSYNIFIDACYKTRFTRQYLQMVHCITLGDHCLN